MTFVKPKRNKYAPEDGRTENIEGSISEIKFPKVVECYTGRAIVVISGRTVVGNLPFLDMHFIYKLVCRVNSHPKYGLQYEIVDYQDEPFKPIPFNYSTLKMILIDNYDMSEYHALGFVCELQEQLGAKQISDSVEPSLLVTLKSPEWVVKMCTELPVFKYEYLSKLSRLWNPRTLARLSFSVLCQVADQLRADPTVFCFSWKNPFPLPEVKKNKLAALKIISGKKLEPNFEICVSAYGRISAWLNDNARLTFTDAQVRNLGKEVCMYAIKNRIFTSIEERFGDRKDRRWYTRNDFEMLLDMQRLLGEILTKTGDGPLKQRQPSNFTHFTEGQHRAFKVVLDVNLLIVLGDAGTGKTEVGRYIAGRYTRKTVLPVACIGRVAARLNRKFGRGFTIQKVLTHIEKKTKLGKKFVKNVEVLIIDEVSTVTLSLFVQLLRVLPKLLKIVMLGDEKQMPPVERGAILESMIKKYEGTDAVHRLTEIVRTKNEILVNNFRRIGASQTDLNIGDDLASDHPFVLVPREAVPKEAEGRPQGIGIVQRNLRKVLRYYEHTEIQILTQKNVTREDINHAMFNLTRRGAEHYAHNTFYVGEKIMFTENNYGNVEGPEQTRSTAVMNGEVRTIVSIYDVDPHAETPEEARIHEVNCTSDPKNNTTWHRMMWFDDGGRINLRHYEISNISKGSASTVAMSQGSEYKVCVFYIHDRISSTLTVRELYTALTRAKRRVVVIGLPGELEQIIRNPFIQQESTIINWLPELK
jgi:hypothetical protein